MQEIEDKVDIKKAMLDYCCKSEHFFWNGEVKVTILLWVSF
jgi:hypothetical protein